MLIHYVYIYVYVYYQYINLDELDHHLGGFFVWCNWDEGFFVFRSSAVLNFPEVKSSLPEVILEYRNWGLENDNLQKTMK